MPPSEGAEMQDISDEESLGERATQSGLTDGVRHGDGSVNPQQQKQQPNTIVKCLRCDICAITFDNASVQGNHNRGVHG